jgi:hypothetical protein
MTTSAFGVDHGFEDVEKAFGMGGGGALGGGLRKLGQNIGMGARKGAAGAGKMARPNVGAGGARGALGRGQVQAGRGLKQASNFAMKRPGLTGGLAAGGTAGAVGGGGYALGNRRQY